MKLYRALWRQVKILEEKLDFYSQFNPSPLSMKQFIEFGMSAFCSWISFYLFNNIVINFSDIENNRPDNKEYFKV